MDSIAHLLNAHWLRTASYFVATAIALLAALRSGNRTRGATVAVVFWVAAATVLFLLGLSREIDLGARVGGLGRGIAWDEGWYQDRRPVQRLTIYALAAGAVVLALAGTILLRNRRNLVLGFLGMVYLASFVAIRTVSLHDVDALLYRRSFEHVQFNAIFELGGTFFVMLTGILTVAAASRRPH